MKCLHTQVCVFCLQALQRLFYGAGSLAWSTLVHAILCRIRGLRYDWQLFYLRLGGFPRDPSGLPVFYQDLLRAWKLFLMTRSVAAIKGVDLLAEPLIHNPQLRVKVVESRSVRQSLILAEVTRVGDLLDYDRGDWLDPLTLARRMGLSRPRTPGAYFRRRRPLCRPLLELTSTWSCSRARPAHPLPQARWTF
ncbi:unnamed protein product [Lepidochelys olivacea]